jgi:hypothetical protein
MSSLLVADVDGFMVHVSASYADIHAEPEDPADRDALRSRLGEQVREPSFQQRYGGRSFDDVFDVKGLQELHPADAPAEAVGPGFSPQAGDVLVILPPSEGSPSPDPWSGWYRVEGTSWRQVAGD